MLRELSLKTCCLSGNGAFPTLVALPALMVLDVPGNMHLTDAAFVELSRSRMLTDLRRWAVGFQRTVTDASFESIHACTRLRWRSWYAAMCCAISILTHPQTTACKLSSMRYTCCQAARRWILTAPRNSAELPKLFQLRDKCTEERRNSLMATQAEGRDSRDTAAHAQLPHASLVLVQIVRAESDEAVPL
jgi:hypothetical protein